MNKDYLCEFFLGNQLYNNCTLGDEPDKAKCTDGNLLSCPYKNNPLIIEELKNIEVKKSYVVDENRFIIDTINYNEH